VRDYKTGGPITIHVVPHSHDDVGWLKTLDEYFDGERRDIQWTDVRTELNSVISALTADPKRKFCEVEMKFFKMWWDVQDESVRAETKRLVANGQLELINGGWSMHDEACPNYDDMIENMYIGHKFILDTFGVKPRIGWQIDPFGHSSTNARFFSEMGFDAWFFGRLDYQDKNRRLRDKEMEFVWRPYYSTQESQAQIFTHVLWNCYASPKGFDFDITSDIGDPFWINNPDSSDFNAVPEAQKLMADLDERASHYLTDDILVLMGEDFNYMNAEENYINIDNMITYMNANFADKYTFKYSTPSNYVDAVKAHNVTWPTKYDDMFPYSDGPDAYWTGYYTSRPNLKRHVREASRNYHASTQLYSIQALDQSLPDSAVEFAVNQSNKLLDELAIL
jgi:hypothetical protein